MAISLEAIRELKDKTGAGIVDCKKALQETNGDIEAAIQDLRKKGMSKAAKKAGRTAIEGCVTITVKDKKGLLVKVNCETDFVAATDKFKNFAQEVSDLIYSKDYECSSELPTDVDEIRQASIGSLGENMLVPEWKFIKGDGVLFSYSHLSKVGVIVDFVFGKDMSADEDANSLMKNIAMQIAAMNPVSLNVESIPADELEKEKDVYATEARNSGKPENIIEKMVAGKLRKYYEENVLLEQSFILDEEKKVKDLLNEFAKDKGTTIEIKSYIRVSL